MALAEAALDLYCLALTGSSLSGYHLNPCRKDKANLATDVYSRPK